MVGTPFYIMEYCDGRVLWDPLLPDVPKEGRLAIYRAKFETLARLHAVDYAALGLADFGRPGSYVARQISRWGKQYKASETERSSRWTGCSTGCRPTCRPTTRRCWSMATIGSTT